MLFYISFGMWTAAVVGPNYCFLEAFYIKALAPKNNDGSKASFKLVLFK